MNSWRLVEQIAIENACLLIAGIDPWEADPTSQVTGTAPVDMKGAINMAAVTADQPGKIQAARAWLFRAREAVLKGDLKPCGELRLWGRDDHWSPVDSATVENHEIGQLDFHVTRYDLAAWLRKSGYEKTELPEFLKGAEPVDSPEKPLGSREKHSYLKVIAGLMEAQNFDYRNDRPHSLAVALEAELALQAFQINTKTLAKIINELQELPKPTDR